MSYILDLGLVFDHKLWTGIFLGIPVEAFQCISAGVPLWILLDILLGIILGVQQNFRSRSSWSNSPKVLRKTALGVPPEIPIAFLSWNSAWSSTKYFPASCTGNSFRSSTKTSTSYTRESYSCSTTYSHRSSTECSYRSTTRSSTKRSSRNSCRSSTGSLFWSSSENFFLYVILMDCFLVIPPEEHFEKKNVSGITPSILGVEESRERRKQSLQGISIVEIWDFLNSHVHYLKNVLFV